MLNETCMLANGVTIPTIALGTWQVPNDEVGAAVTTALEIGYRHIDTAAAYHNEQGVGQAIQDAQLGRSEIFITSKIPAEIKTYEEAKAVIVQSLVNLQTDVIDLMLIHAPKPWAEMFKGGEKQYFAENIAVWQALEEAYQAGHIRSIGVSNFEFADLENLMENCTIKPHVNQIRIHIGHTPSDVIAFCQHHDIVVEAYSPNATGRLVGHTLLTEMAAKYQVSVPQLGIRYTLQLGTVSLPKTTKKAHMIQNADVNFEISQDDMAILAQVEEI